VNGGGGLCPNAKRVNFAHVGDVAMVIVGAQCVASIHIDSAVDSVVLKVRAASPRQSLERSVALSLALTQPGATASHARTHTR